uniref:PIN domain-containing protein n=1 Tax=Wuchereria bancrofti TaxID=6293 RepID=A0AAF5PIK3_WUCBA
MQANNCRNKENTADEWIDMDLVMKEVRTFRTKNFWCPNLRFEYPTCAQNHMEVGGIKNVSPMTVVVFDTSGLLRDTALLPLCIEKLYHVLIPYTVLKELDGLKRTDYEKLRVKVIKIHRVLHEYSKSGCGYLHIENVFEASFGVKEFGCQNNDDVILKCAFVTTNKYKNGKVIFVTNDRNLAMKAMAHNIVAVDRFELIKFVVDDILNGRKTPSAAESSAQQKPHKIPYTAPVEYSHPKIRGNGRVVPNETAHSSSSRFEPVIFMRPPPVRHIFMQNNQFPAPFPNRFPIPSWDIHTHQFLQMFAPYSFQILHDMVKLKYLHMFPQSCNELKQYLSKNGFINGSNFEK